MKVWCICLILLSGGGFAGSAGATSPAAARPTEYPELGPDVFDYQADGAVQLQAALAEAKAAGKHVALILGANWCPWCHRFDALLRSDAALQRHWERDYVIVRIDVNWKSFTKRNEELLARYRRPPQRGIPVLTLLDARGRVLANPDISQWETKEPKDYDVARVREFFAKWAPAPATPLETGVSPR